MLFYASIPVGARFFLDVESTDWGLDAINFVSDNGYFVNDSLYFGPDEKIGRVVVARAIYIFEGSPTTIPRKIYSDISHYDSPGGIALTWAYDHNIMRGTSATLFEPFKSITREDFAVVLYRYAAYKGYNTTKGNNVNLSGYTDSGSISNYAVTAIKWAVGSNEWVEHPAIP